MSGLDAYTNTIIRKINERVRDDLNSIINENTEYTYYKTPMVGTSSSVFKTILKNLKIKINSENLNKKLMDYYIGIEKITQVTK